MKKTIRIVLVCAVLLLLVSIPFLLIEKVEERPVKDLYVSVDTKATFVFIGDNGSGKQEQFNVASIIQKNCTTPTCKGVFVVGDDIYKGGVKSATDPQFISKFEEPYKNISQPFYMALGNHDYRGCVNCYLKYADANKKFVLPATYYTVHFGKLVDVFVIDTERFVPVQQKWLASEIAASSAQWKIVAGHRPLKSYANVARWEDVFHIREMNALRKILCNNVNVYVSGHTHALEYPGPIAGCSVKQLVSGGGGVTDLHPQIVNAPDVFYKEGFGIVRIDVSSNKALVRFIGDKNQTLFQLVENH